jgi:hypothetical protein
MHFRGLRGVRGVEDNKNKPNFILTLEDTANQLWWYIYLHIYIYHMAAHEEP